MLEAIGLKLAFFWKIPATYPDGIMFNRVNSPLIIHIRAAFPEPIPIGIDVFFGFAACVGVDLRISLNHRYQDGVNGPKFSVQKKCNHVPVAANLPAFVEILTVRSCSADKDLLAQEAVNLMPDR